MHGAYSLLFDTRVRYTCFNDGFSSLMPTLVWRMMCNAEHYDAFMHAMRGQAIATVPSKANDDLFILQ